jgi:acyl-CoA reductase-like NAD-dependent aldehyde dehydrogenase
LERGLEDRKEELVEILAIEAGKTVRSGREEIERGIEVCRIGISELYKGQGEMQEYTRMDYNKRGEKTEMLIRREPLGVIAMIAPWNFPINLILHKIVPAIVSGCPWILKPSSYTPVSALVIGEILASIPEAILPRGSWSIIPASREAADALVTSELVKVLSFTGSPAVGWKLKSRAARGTKVLLELGGNASCIVETWPRAEEERKRMIKRLVMGGYSGAGQSCIHMQKMLVKSEIFEQVVGEMLSEIRKMKMGDPKEEEVDIGPIISEKECERIEEWVEKGKGRKIIGGKREGRIFPPTLLENVDENSEIWNKEIFGPIVCVKKYEKIEQAWKIVNDSKFAIHCGIFCDNMEIVWKSFDNLQVAGLVVNDVPSVRMDAMPYGGIKESGIGREGVKYAVLEFTEMKTLLWRRSP